MVINGFRAATDETQGQPYRQKQPPGPADAGPLSSKEQVQLHSLPVDPHNAGSISLRIEVNTLVGPAPAP